MPTCLSLCLTFVITCLYDTLIANMSVIYNAWWFVGNLLVSTNPERFDVFFRGWDKANSKYSELVNHYKNKYQAYIYN